MYYLIGYADAVSFKDNSSYYNLGSKCRLIIIDVDSGKDITRAPRWASDSGLCWLPDAQTVLFPSFDDEKLYKTTKSEVRGDTSYPAKGSALNLMPHNLGDLTNGLPIRPKYF